MKLVLKMFLVCMLLSNLGFAQGCTSEITIQLKNIKGGVFANQLVTLVGRGDGKEFTAKSNASGEAKLSVPCDVLYDVSIANYPRKKEVLSPSSEGAKVTRSFSYEWNAIAKEKQFEMNETEKAAVDAKAKSLPDSIVMATSVMPQPINPDLYSQLSISIVDLQNKPLANEGLSIVGEKRNKKIKATTDKDGRLVVYLPKGDKYYVNFKYNKNFIANECVYSKGSAKSSLNFSYLGTKEIEKRKKEEAARIAAEEKRLKEAEIAFAKKCKKWGVSLEEGRKREVEEMIKSSWYGSDSAVTAALRRNCWSEKLIVCDLTGSMSPYAAQLSAWYQLTYQKEKNLQFVFFNDGNEMPDDKKVIGNTGGIYYAPSEGITPLFNTIAKVSAAGSGGDCPENNMEALIKGTQMAKPYKELVMIADNYAPVKDIRLLKDFDKPVHIIVCGADNGILEDYLNIAKKTKGSIHTMEEDITNLASKAEGQELQIGKFKYKVMGGEFVRM